VWKSKQVWFRLVFGMVVLVQPYGAMQCNVVAGAGAGAARILRLSCVLCCCSICPLFARLYHGLSNRTKKNTSNTAAV